MKKIILFISVLFLAINCFTQKKQGFPVLKGSYLGQKPPGIKAEVFLYGLISTKEKSEMNTAFTRNSKEFYYCACNKNSWAIFCIREINAK